MNTPKPDSDWYISESFRLGLKSPRCPFSNVHTCPRYFSSLSLSGQAGGSGISKKDKESLNEFWQKSPLLPRSGDQEPALIGNGKKTLSYYQFCPEVAYDIFGIFASGFSDYYDEEEKDHALRKLKKEDAPPGDLRWTWSSVEPQHYSACPIYSQLTHEWVKTPPYSCPAPKASTQGARYDAFVSHATEDKVDFVRPLVGLLESMGLKVWFDEATLHIGDSIREKIDEGLLNSDFGIVVLSPAFLRKSWTRAELDALFTIERPDRKVILPVWHNLSHSEVSSFSLLLSAKLAAQTRDGVDAVAKGLFDAISASKGKKA